MADNRTSNRKLSRRTFLAETAGGIAGAGLLATGLASVATPASARPAWLLRPPGALPEKAFLSACVRCGQCVQACPYDTLRPARVGEGTAPGTPVFEARKVACEMCPDVPCVKACPTGALDPALQDINEARMGLAVLIDRENCLNIQGLRCDVCYRNCPVSGKAITLEMRRNERTGRHAIFEPTVHSDACTGCGKCERTCVLEKAAIKVLPYELARGELGRHYRFSWLSGTTDARSEAEHE